MTTEYACCAEAETISPPALTDLGGPLPDWLDECPPEPPDDPGPRDAHSIKATEHARQVPKKSDQPPPPAGDGGMRSGFATGRADGPGSSLKELF